jgi:hypothetical protein
MKILSPISKKNYRFVLHILTRAFENIFSITPINTHTACLPLKIMQNFYMEHDHLVEDTLANLSLPILRYIYKYHIGYPFSTDVFKAGERFMENIPSHFGVLLSSLSDVLAYEIKSKKDENCLEITNLVEFTFEKLLLNKEEGFDYYLQKAFMKSIIIGILRSFSSLNPDDLSKFTFILPAINLLLKILDSLERLIFKSNSEGGDGEDEMTPSERARMNTFGNTGRMRDLEEDLLRSGTSFNLDLDFETTLDAFGHVYKVIVKELEKNENNVKILHLFNLASKILFKLQKFYKNKKLSTLPQWFTEVARCTVSENPHISIIAVETSIAILTSEEVDPIYSDLKNLIINMPRNSSALQAVQVFRNGADYTKVTFERLWCLLDYHYYQNKIVELIISFQKSFPKVFAEVVASSFQLHSVTEKEFVIRRFATFWRLTGEFAKTHDLNTAGRNYLKRQ